MGWKTDRIIEQGFEDIYEKVFERVMETGDESLESMRESLRVYDLLDGFQEWYDET